VCLATSGPGGIHLLTGLYDAKLDHASVLAITGMQETTVLGTGHQQEVHLDRLYGPGRAQRDDHHPDLDPGPG
jgi:pyruvate dehydrogenase (quinone)